MGRTLLDRALVITLAAAASLGLPVLIIAGAARLEAETLAATPTCAGVGVSTDPATALLLSPDLNAPACVFHGAQGQTPLPVDLPVSQPIMLSGKLPVPRPQYHHVGTWNADVVRERATVHSSKLISVETRPGECFWRTSHLVSWGADRGDWVESGFFQVRRWPLCYLCVHWLGRGFARVHHRARGVQGCYRHHFRGMGMGQPR